MQRARKETLPRFLSDCADTVIERLVDSNNSKSTEKVPNASRRLSSPRREHKPHCSNDVTCQPRAASVTATSSSLRYNQATRRPTVPLAKSPLPSSRVEMDRLPNFSGIDISSAIAEGSELLKEIKSWHKTLERDSRPQPVTQRQKPYSDRVAIKKADLARKGDVAKKTGGELDLRTDMESLKKEVKRLSKKISRKSEKRHSEKEKKETRFSDKGDSQPQVHPKVKHHLVKTMAHVQEPEPQQNKLSIATLQNLVIKRPLSVQSGPRIMISPKPVLTKVSNVHFATFEHQPEAVPAKQLDLRMVHVSMENAAVSTDAIPVSTTGCQTSPPPQVFSIFAQTEEVTLRTTRTMVSVAVQSSPEYKAPCSHLQVQTEAVCAKSVATETASEVKPEALKVSGEVMEPPITEIGPSGDATAAFEVTIHQQDKPKEFVQPNRVSLSPIIEVPSTTISLDLISPLTTPKMSLVIPESSQSDQSYEAPKQEPLEKEAKLPTKSVGFADLPMLLRLRSPTQRMVVPNYTRPVLAKPLNLSISTDDDEDESTTKNVGLPSSEVQSTSVSRSTSPTSTASSLEFTTSSSAVIGPKAPISIPIYQMNRIRSLASKVAPKLLEHSTSDGELSEGQVWPLPRLDHKKIQN